MAANKSSHRQTRLVFFSGFGGLLLLLGALGVSAISFLSRIRVREEKIRDDYLTRDRVLQSVRAEIYTSGTYIRESSLTRMRRWPRSTANSFWKPSGRSMKTSHGIGRSLPTRVNSHSGNFPKNWRLT